MKTTLIIALLFLGSLNTVLGQVLTVETNPSAQEIYDFHIRKKKTNNTAALVSLGGGVAMIIGGIAINLSGDWLDDNGANNNKGLWLSYVGGATTLASIPLFISAGSHKKKAKIQLQNGAVGFDTKFKYKGISFALSF